MQNMNEPNSYNEIDKAADDTAAVEERKPEKKSSFIKDLIKDIVIAVVIVLAITSVVKPTIVKEDRRTIISLSTRSSTSSRIILKEATSSYSDRNCRIRKTVERNSSSKG